MGLRIAPDNYQEMKFTITDKLSLDSAFTQAQAMLKAKGSIEVTVTGGKRKLTQNALAFEWYGQVAIHLGDHTVEEVHAISKLHVGVPLMRSEDAEYSAAYDLAIKPLPYETKLEAMKYWPTTRLMNKEQMSSYLEQLQRFWAQRCGIVLERKETT